jgi:NifU-like protein involved in Fe-S cluster formation/intein/homing endonuclease
VAEKKWFYTDIVKEHFFNPRNILKTDKEAEEFAKNADGVGEVGSPICGDVMKLWIKIKDDKITDCKWQTFGSLLPGARILMSDFNIKNVEDISIGDRVFDGAGKNNIIEEILIRDYKGKIISIQLSTSKFYNFVLTPNHPVPCVKRNNISAVNRKSGKRWSEVSKDKISNYPIELISASELKEGDFMVFNIPQKVKDVAELDEDMCSLLGYYVSDGSSPSKNRTIFYFGLNELEFVEDIEKIAKKREWRYKTYKRNTENVVCVQLNEPVITKLLLKYGGLPSRKNFSSTILFLPHRKQEKIINAYINGDGWILQQNENWQPQYFISTSKENLAYQLQIMLGRLGIFAPIHKRESREFTKNGKIYRNSGEFNLIFRKNAEYSRIKFHKKENAFLIPISKIQILDYKGKIYDPGLVYAPKTYRVNGISLHNCASAIASASMMSEIVKEDGGMKVEDALKLTAQDIVKRLEGLPARKIHCSVLGHKALKAALNDYFCKTNQKERMTKDEKHTC